MKSSALVRAVAMLEAGKGLLVLLAGIGALSFIHEDLQALAERLVGHLHLNPASEYPRIFIEMAARLNGTRLATLAMLAACYALLRLIEAYGLWRSRRWAEWLAALSGGVYIPFELVEVFRGDLLLSLVALVVNVVVVGVMVNALYRGPAARAARTG